MRKGSGFRCSPSQRGQLGFREVSFVISHDEKSGTSQVVNASEDPALSPEADTHGRKRARKLIRTIVLRAVGFIVHPTGGFYFFVLIIRFRGRNCREYNTDLPG